MADSIEAAPWRRNRRDCQRHAAPVPWSRPGEAPMIAQSEEDLHNIRLAVERIHKLSDRLIGLGPFGVGLDGILSFIPIPGVGVAYSGLAALALMVQAVRARASAGVLFHMAVILTIDTL